MKNFFQILSLSFFLSLESTAQDQIFLNTNQSLIFLNPSFAGSNGGIRNQFSYRSEYPNLSGGISTVGNSFDAFVRPLKAGIALNYLNNDFYNDLFASSSLNFSYAQHLSFFDKSLKIIPSVQIGYGQRKVDMEALTSGNSWFVIADGYPNGNLQERKDYVDISSGILMIIRSNWNVGAYLFHINQPDVGLMGTDKLPTRFLFHSSYTFHFSERTQLQLFYRYQQQYGYTTNQITANVVLFKYLVTGLSYLSGDQVQILVGLRNNYCSIQAGYDRSYSKLAGNSNGSWEVHAAFYLRNKENRKTLSNFENW